MTQRIFILATLVLSACTANPYHYAFTQYERDNLLRNRAWISQREAARDATAHERVAVFADAGVWHEGARGVVTALESANVPCRVFDREHMTPETLKQFEVLVLPGGWAPLQRAALGDAGMSAIQTYVQGGGRLVGICAGAYLVSEHVHWEKETSENPASLFDGTADGPLDEIAKFPNRAPVRITVTAAGQSRGLSALATRDVLYFGGPRFLEGTNVDVLALYPDKTPAIIARHVGQGEIILTGIHLERPADKSDNDEAPPPPSAGIDLKALLLST